MVAKIGDFDGDDRRHQWGAETSTQPLAIMHAKPSPTRVVRGYVAIYLHGCFMADLHDHDDSVVVRQQSFTHVTFRG